MRFGRGAGSGATGGALVNHAFPRLASAAGLSGGTREATCCPAIAVTAGRAATTERRFGHCYSVGMNNRLRHETSPYLLQHADNPVHWQPWDEQALRLARESDRPILLSIGYSACHWCHVMAHESFEDADTAALMNERFVNIKVDREERPDLDRIYQLAHQLFVGRGGGWPLTAFLTPDSHLPIAVGTYFPLQPRYGMPAFSEVLRRVADYYAGHRKEITTQGHALVDALRRMDERATARDGQPLDAAPLHAARESLRAGFDVRHGGFGGAPKFPRAGSLELALELWHDATDADTGTRHEADLMSMVTFSLSTMAARGLYDHLAGGFFRYAVDEAWAIPHFEKMLYDNASLLALYADAWAATGQAAFATAATETARWLNLEMAHAQGGWYAALDADSEGEEGRYYLWTPEQFESLLPAPQSEVAKTVYGLYREPNFEGSEWHLHHAESVATVAAANDTATDEVQALLDSARQTLLDARRGRPAPERDDKVLTAWNALTARAMARAARRLRRPDLAQPALAAIDFIRGQLWDGRRLKAVYKDGRSRFNAYLDDHAFMMDALLETLQCRWRTADLEFAIALADTLLERFQDARGGFCFVADDHEALIHRPRSFADEAIPSGNGIALSSLLVLGHLLGETRYVDAAERGLLAARQVVLGHPDSYAATLHALALYLHPPELIIIRGTREETHHVCEEIGANYHPRRYVFSIPPDVGTLPGLLATRLPASSGAVAYRCAGTRCDLPETDINRLIDQL